MSDKVSKFQSMECHFELESNDKIGDLFQAVTIHVAFQIVQQCSGLK